MAMKVSSIGLYAALITLIIDGILIDVASGEGQKETVPYGLLRSHKFNWNGRRSLRSKRYLDDIQRKDLTLPISWMSKKSERESGEKLPMQWMSKKRAEVEGEELPMAWMSKKDVDEGTKLVESRIPMRFMWSKKSIDVCKRAIEVCSKSIDKRSTETEILNELEKQLKDQKVSL